MDNTPLACPSCKATISSTDYFCSNCGKKIKNKPLSTSAGSQTATYLISFFLPPFGLFRGFKYLRQEDGKSKVIGIIACILTIISLTISTSLTLNFANALNQELNTQLQLYQNLGY